MVWILIAVIVVLLIGVAVIGRRRRGTVPRGTNLTQGGVQMPIVPEIKPDRASEEPQPVMTEDLVMKADGSLHSDVAPSPNTQAPPKA